MEIRPRIAIEEDIGPIAAPPPEPNEGGMPKRGRIYRDEALRFGLDFNCLGCRAVNTGAKAQGHREECRKRIEEELRKEGKQERFDKPEAKRKKYQEEKSVGMDVERGTKPRGSKQQRRGKQTHRGAEELEW